jgi:hypothetical protein
VSRDETRYLKIQGGDAERYRNANEFRYRPVLPTPHFVANATEPEWNDIAAVPKPSSSAGTGKRPPAVHQRKEVDNNEIVDVVVRNETTKKGGLTFDIGLTKQVGVLATSKTLPEELRLPGTKLKMRVRSGGKTPQLEWIDPSAPPPAAPPKPKGGGARHK